jgi:hypothetical protein
VDFPPGRLVLLREQIATSLGGTMDIDVLTQYLNDSGYDEWEVIDDVSLMTPDGDIIEWDGEGSPLIALGLI